MTVTMLAPDVLVAGGGGWRQAVAPHAILLHCLIARDFDNFSMAGKCINGDQVAALLVSHDAHLLRAKLTQAGMQLDPKRHTPMLRPVQRIRHEAHNANQPSQRRLGHPG